MNRIFQWLTPLIVALASVAYGISFAWPAYDWDLCLPSPDGRYDLIVLRSDAAAFSDFSYHIYLFPHALSPHDRPKSSRVWLTPMWRGTKYLVYSGYNYPMFRWTGPHSVEIDFKEMHPTPFTINPVKSFGGLKNPVTVSIIFGKANAANALP